MGVYRINWNHSSGVYKMTEGVRVDYRRFKPVTGMEIVRYTGAQYQAKYQRMHSALLGLEFTAKEATALKKLPKEDLETIARKKYVAVGWECHPDRNPLGEERFKHVTEAWNQFKHFLPQYREKGNPGYIDAMLYAHVRF